MAKELWQKIKKGKLLLKSLTNNLADTKANTKGKNTLADTKANTKGKNMIMTRHMSSIMVYKSTPPEPVMNQAYGKNTVEYYNREMRAYCEREAHYCFLHKSKEGAAKWEALGKHYESMCHY